MIPVLTIIRPAMRVSCCCLLIVMLNPLSGCDSDSRKASARLRREVHDLKIQVESLQRNEAELKQKLAHAHGPGYEMDAEELASTPFVAEITLSPLSGMQRNDDQGPVLELFVKGIDGRSRPLQLIGTLHAVAVSIPQEGEPVPLGRVELSPSQVRDSWRSGLTGTSYLVEVPLEQEPPDGTASVHVRVFHKDARTGRSHEASGDIRTRSADAGVE